MLYVIFQYFKKLIFRRSEQAASITDVDIEKYRDIFKVNILNGIV